MNIAVLGAQWGDEGKGKIVDLLTPHFSIVARYQGGHNAGHTVYANGRKFVLRLLPSGILHDGITCVIGNGVVVDPVGAVRGDRRAQERRRSTSAIGWSISDKAHLILPYHRELDLLSEARRGERKIGTTSRGIGPAYEDKIARRGVRVGDLANTAALREAVRHNVDARNRLIGDSVMDANQVVADLAPPGPAWGRGSKTSRFSSRAPAPKAESIMFEGAQGTLLDIDHGTYPVRHLLERHDRRRLHWPRRAAPRDRRRAGRREGLHHARRRRAAADGADRGDRRSPARDRPGVRRGHGSSATVRVGRRGGGALCRARQRPRRAGLDEARRAGWA